MPAKKLLTKEELKDVAIRYCMMHGREIEQIRALLEINLTQLCKAYCLQHHLPNEAVTVKTRTKTLTSILNKLERKQWPQFLDPASVINDLIGARVTCWFLDDCAGILHFIAQAGSLQIVTRSAENYITHPKHSRYRALHVLVNVSYTSVKLKKQGQAALAPAKMVCEIQIRTRLQDAWGDITHELYYRAKHLQLDNKKYNAFLSGISNRLLREDRALLKLKKVYRHLVKGGRRQ